MPEDSERRLDFAPFGGLHCAAVAGRADPGPRVESELSESSGGAGERMGDPRCALTSTI